MAVSKRCAPPGLSTAKDRAAAVLLSRFLVFQGTLLCAVRYVPVVTQGHLWFTESLHPFQASG